MKNKYYRPIWYRYLRVKRRYGISKLAAVRVSIISFLFLFANGFLQSSVANNGSFLESFLKAVLVLSIAPIYRRIEVYAEYVGLFLLILFGSLGFAAGTKIF